LDRIDRGFADDLRWFGFAHASPTVPGSAFAHVPRTPVIAEIV